VNNSEITLASEIRMETAKKIILGICPDLDSENVFGIAGFGSFWTPNIRRNPKDIDIAVFARNDSSFSTDDKPKLAIPLSNMFYLPTEFHIITPYTPSVRHELEHVRILLQEATILWGNFPEWLHLSK
jgi:hypothetical protein